MQYRRKKHIPKYNIVPFIFHFLVPIGESTLIWDSIS